MQNFKITNLHTNKEINLNYTELQDFMRINRKDFFYNYTIQRIEKTNILKNIIAFLIVSFGSIALLMLGGLLDKI
tara:strand:+ start:781 stop:1005 length:225 start_codon:yes stop_codon:yes gene_type:complete